MTALTVNTNVASLNAQRNLSQASGDMNKSLERLSTGMRINSAKDDAAGMQISNRLTSQINGLGVAARNAKDGISMAQVAEGALQESSNILQRMRDLSLQSVNGGLSAEDKDSIQGEMDTLKSELNRIAETTAFGGKNLLDGSLGTASFQVGSEANQTIEFSIGNASAESLGNVNKRSLDSEGNAFTAGSMNITGDGTETVAVVATDSAADIARKVNVATDSTGVTADAKTELQVGTILGDIGDQISFNLSTSSTSSTEQAVRFTVGSSQSESLENLRSAINEVSSKTGVTADINDAGNLIISEADGNTVSFTGFAETDVDGTNTTAATVAISGVNADGTAGAALAGGPLGAGADVTGFGSVTFMADQTFNVAGTAADDLSAITSTRVADIDVTTEEGAQTAIQSIDAALKQIDEQRADLGAVQNRFDSTISNLQNISENVTAARSRIQDTDYASETANRTKNQILQQAGTSILAQANQLPQAALSLLG